MHRSTVAGRVAGYLAAAWAFVFAAASFYWALGGTLGVETIAPAITSLVDDPMFVAIGLWGAGVAKAIGGVLALALILARLPVGVRRALGWLALIGGALVAPYGGASLVQHALMVLGVIGTPAALGSTAARWHLFLWDPWWLIGGLLFVVTGRAALSTPAAFDSKAVTRP